MALSGTIQGSCTGTSGNKYDLWADWTVNNQSVSNNSSNITVLFKLQRNDGVSGSAFNMNTVNPVSLSADNLQRVSQQIAIDTRNSAVVTLASWTGNISHAPDGTKTLSISGSFHMVGITSLTGGSLSGTASITAIDQASPVISLSISSITNNGFRISASSDVPCENWQYQLNGGAWSQYRGGVATSAAVTISGLQPLTQYSVRVRAQRASNYKYGYSSTEAATTTGVTKILSYESAFYADDDPSVIDAAVSVASTSYTHTLEIYHNGILIPDTTTNLGTFAVGTHSNILQLGSSARTALLYYMRNTKYIPVTVKLIAKSGSTVMSTEEKTLTAYTRDDNSAPILSGFTFKDNFAQTVAVTGDDQTLIQNHSQLQVTFGSVTLRNSATIAQYIVFCGNQTKSSTTNVVNMGEISTSGTGSMVGVAVDSRGYTHILFENVRIASYAPPNLTTVTARRKDGVGQDIMLTLEGLIYNINVGSPAVNKNSLTEVQFRTKKTSEGTFGSWQSIFGDCDIDGNEFSYDSTETTQLDPEHSYDMQVRVRDALGLLSAYTVDLVIPQGIPLADICRDRISFNCELETNGIGILGMRKQTVFDFNNLTEQGLYYFDLIASSQQYPSPHMPPAPEDMYVQVMNMTGSKVIQTAYAFGGSVSDIFFRRGTYNSGTDTWTWTSWKAVL